MKRLPIRFCCIEFLNITSISYHTKFKKSSSIQPLINTYGAIVLQYILSHIEYATVAKLALTVAKKHYLLQCIYHEKQGVGCQDATLKSREVDGRKYSDSVLMTAAITAFGVSTRVFVPSGDKLNSQRYILDVIVTEAF